ncbi:MAG: CotH kinase family protein [Myxococcota bacterium]
MSTLLNTVWVVPRGWFSPAWVVGVGLVALACSQASSGGREGEGGSSWSAGGGGSVEGGSGSNGVRGGSQGAGGKGVGSGGSASGGNGGDGGNGNGGNGNVANGGGNASGGSGNVGVGGMSMAGQPGVPPGAFEGTQSGLVFAPPRGTREVAFDLKITHATATSVRYTLDCSDPRTSSSAMVAKLPLTLRVDPADTAHRFLAPGFIVRATVGDASAGPETVVTHSYTFPKRVVELSPDGKSPGTGWPAPRAPGGTQQAMDYGMDPDVTRSAEYQGLVEPALLSLPNLSIVTDLPNLFDATIGIYANALNEGVEWERFASLELVNQDSVPGFQANMGLRIRGGTSRDPSNPKHAFRALFKGAYGTPKLLFPLFGNEGPSTFDKIDIRTEQNYSWSIDGGAEFNENTLTRDVFSRDLQRELGRPYTRSRFYHLYLDGVYWGLFQTQERADSHYGQTYLGGNDGNYDVVKTERSFAMGQVEASDGDLTAWTNLWQLTAAGFDSDEAYYRLEGKDANGARNASLPVLVDIDNLIDYMLVIFYTANFDGPVSKWFKNNQANNFYALRDRVVGEKGFVFLAHDNEHTLHPDVMLITQGVDEDRVNIGTPGAALDGMGRPSDVYRMNITDVAQSNPQWLHFRLSSNAKYRQRFAARARTLLSDGGKLSAASVTALHQKRVAEIESAIVAESARWGDAQRPNQPRTKNGDWAPAVKRVVDGFFAKRTPIVIQQLTKAGLY